MKGGHSISRLVLAPDEMPLTTITVSDVLVILTADGYAKIWHYLEQMTPDEVVFTIPNYADVVTEAEVVVIDPKAAPKRIPKTSLGLVFLAAAVQRARPFPMEALRTMAEAGRFSEVNLESIETGITLLG